MAALPASETRRASRVTRGTVLGRAGATGLRARRFRARLGALAFLAPAVVLMVVYRLGPMLDAIRLSFTTWDGFSEPVWTGLANYVNLAGDERFLRSLVVNLQLLLAVPVLVVVPFVLAALLQSRVPGWGLFRAVYFFPTLLSPVVIGLAFKMVLKEDGPVNEGLRLVGLDALTRIWLKDTTWALVWVVIIAGWSVIGTGIVLFLAAMGGVDTSLVEAARIDGANWWGVQRHVVFWQILPVIEMWAVLLVISMLTSLFPMILIMTGGGPSYSTSTADLYAYQQAFENFQPGYASAASVAITVLTIAVVAIVMGVFRRGREV